jgi:hypothetical protein
VNTSLRLDDWNVRAVLLVLGISQADAARAFSRVGKKEGFSRFGNESYIRARVMVGLRQLAPGGCVMSYPTIARLCGMRTHTGVIDACRRGNILASHEKEYLSLSGQHSVGVIGRAR